MKNTTRAHSTPLTAAKVLFRYLLVLGLVVFGSGLLVSVISDHLPIDVLELTEQQEEQEEENETSKEFLAAVAENPMADALNQTRLGTLYAFPQDSFGQVPTPPPEASI